MPVAVMPAYISTVPRWKVFDKINHRKAHHLTTTMRVPVITKYELHGDFENE